MPRKKPKLSEKERKELERQKQEEAEKERELEKERMLIKLLKEERENAMRRVMLDFTSKHFERIEQQMKSVRKTEKEQKIWQQYLDPEASPDPSNPAALRSYLHQWELNDANQSKSRIDPRLSLIERSILSQDVSTIDKRLKNFQAIRKPVGDSFLPRIKQILDINNEILDFLEESGPYLCDRIYNDLKSLQVIFRKELTSYLDKWSFEILSDIDRDMRLIDPITAEYNYESDIIKHFLWTFRQVPLPPNYTQVNCVSMIACKSEFTKSNMMDMAELCLRGLVLKYDHLTDYAPTYKISAHLPALYDLKTELMNEQMILMELRVKKLEKMRENRRLFEEEKTLLVEQETLVLKDTKKGTKKGNSVKQKEKPRKNKSRRDVRKVESAEEPPIVDENTIVDASDELMSVLKDNFIIGRERLDPIYLDLDSGEINLRDMVVLGVDQPDVLRHSNFFYNYIESPKPRLSLMHMKDTKRKSIFPKQINTIEKPRSTLYIQERRTTILQQDFEEQEKRWVSENEINQKKLFEMRIKIPDQVYWWEAPSVCRWEPWEESDSFKKLSPAMQNFNLNYETVLEERQRKFFAAPPTKRDFKTIKRLQDTKLSEVKQSLPSHYLITEYLMPRMIDNYKFSEEIRDDAEKETKEKENRLKLRKEAIERERKRLAEELEGEKSKTVARESRLVSFAETHHEAKFVEGETQTDFAAVILNMCNKEILPIRQYQQSTRKIIETDKSSISFTEESSNVFEATSIDEKQRISVATQTCGSSLPNSRNSSKANSIASKRISSRLSISEKNRRMSSSESLKAQFNDEKLVGSSDEGSPLIIQARSSFIPSFVQVTPENTPPKFLFNKKKRLKPLEIVKSLEEEESLQSIQLTDILSSNSDGFDEDNTTLSRFLAYLEDLQEKEKPFFHSDSYIDRIIEQLEAKEAEDLAEATAKKLKELKHQLRISKFLEAKQRESTFYRVPRKSIAEVSKSRVWSVINREQKKRPKPTTQKNPLDSLKNETTSSESKTEEANNRVVEQSNHDSRNQDEHLELIAHFPGKWTTKHIHCESFNADTKTISFKAGLFGNFGLLTTKYVNFPYKCWRISPKIDEQEVTVTLQVKYTTIEFQVTSRGFKVGIHLQTKSFMSEVVPIISEFVSFKVLQEKMKSINVNVFPEPDACYYIPNVSEKLYALEDHCYKCLAMFCLTHEFKSCHWNCYTDYRTILLNSKCLSVESSRPEDYREVLVTPSKSEFVHVSQKCSEDVFDVNLRFTPNPPHQDFNADLYHTIMGEIISLRKVFDNTDQMLQWNIFELLSAIKIFSFTK